MKCHIKHIRGFTDLIYEVRIDDGEPFLMHTYPSGGLWIQNRQVEGTIQFSPGRNASAAIRRWLQSPHGATELARKRLTP